MTKLNNGLMDFPSLICDVETALDVYAHSPASGLQSLKLAFTVLQDHVDLESYSDSFASRLSTYLSAIDALALLGAPYSAQYHTAFLSAADSLFQVVLAVQFSPDHLKQLLARLSSERTCWTVLSLLANEYQKTPTYKNYEAKLLSADAKAEPVTVDAYLSSLGGLGNVSFSLDEIEGSSLSGRFSLKSVQSIDWLRNRFPMLQWAVAVSHDSALLRDVCEASFLPLFQHGVMNRESRYALLEKIEDQIKGLFYRQFGALFKSDFINVKNVNRLVPVPSNVAYLNEGAEAELLSVYSPIRHGGFFYTGLITQEGLSSVSYVERLGQDVLSYFLYEIETSAGKVVFDKAECLGCRQMTQDNTTLVDDSIWLQVNEEIQAQVVLCGVEVPTMKNALFQDKPLIDVLITEQLGEYFALPFLSIKEVEAVCSKMTKLRLWAKNIWLGRDGKPLLEPWLVKLERLPEAVHSTLDKVPEYAVKKGYYLGQVCGKSFWIDASLMFSVLPYQQPYESSNVDGSILPPFIVHDGRCFDRVVLIDRFASKTQFVEKDPVFSVILEWAGSTLVLPFDVCDWKAELPSEVMRQDFYMSIDSTELECDQATALWKSGSVLIDRTNFLSFVDGFWSSSLSFGSDD